MWKTGPEALKMWSCARARARCALGSATFRLTRSRVGRAEVASVTARPQARHALSQFLLVCFIHIPGFSPSFQPTSGTIYLSTGVSVKRADPHTNRVTLQAAEHKRLGKKASTVQF